MPAIDVVPFVLKDVTLTLGVDSYEKHVSEVKFTPTASALTWIGLGGNTVSDVATATWTATLGYAQDWETVDSLSQYLLANEGESVEASFKPKSGSGPSFTATLTITPGAIGGPVNAYATTSVTLGSTKPVLVPGI